MNADKDDAPARIRRGRANPWRARVIMGIGSVMVGALVALSARPAAIDVGALTAALHQGTPPIPHPTAAQPVLTAPHPRSELVSTSPEQATLSWAPAAQADAPPARQTVFNDQNYAHDPSRINTLHSTPVRYTGETRSQQRAPVVRTLTDSWNWTDGKRRRIGGRFEWIEQDGQIDYSSVCRNYERGSLIYRDCRKGAKARFAELCGRHKPACHAANNFMP
ncbi:hypothetical protein [Stutzerimonas tarimensis]|uniref:Uncharacterized protein n=1 Tax=Stutzerimonas tarimensis TaxID=1507735 RepID=A0ABV7T3N0_9GAMM